MNLFFKAINLNDLKREFRKLCMKLHPDKGGDTNVFQAMYAEYEYLLSAYGREAKQDNSRKYSAYEYDAKVDLKVWEQAEIFARLSGVKVEIIGQWIWVSGNTTAHNEIFHYYHCKWSRAKFAWYWFDGIEKSHGKVKGFYNKLDTLRDIWGTKDVPAGEDIRMQQ